MSAQNPWGKSVELPPDLRQEVRDFINALGPADPEQAYTYLQDAEIVRRWRKLSRRDISPHEPKISKRLLGLLMDTGDVSIRRFDGVIHMGNGSHSTYQCRVLLDRLQWGLTELGGQQQYFPNRDTAEAIRDVIRDVARALGEDIQFVSKGDDCETDT